MGFLDNFLGKSAYHNVLTEDAFRQLFRAGATIKVKNIDFRTGVPNEELPTRILTSWREVRRYLRQLDELANKRRSQ